MGRETAGATPRAIHHGIATDGAERMAPLLKWAGGKQAELKHILPRIPPHARYFEPFVGGGAVFFSLRPMAGAINDASDELIALYRLVAAQDVPFFRVLDTLLAHWQAVSALMDAMAERALAAAAHIANAADLAIVLERMLAEHILRDAAALHALLAGPGDVAPLRVRDGYAHEIRRSLAAKLTRMRWLEAARGVLPPADILANIECALKSACYTHCRTLYNHRDALTLAPASALALYLFIRENAYAAMFRYNQSGHFNVPYGGISYNRKDLARKLARLRTHAMAQLLGRTYIACQDFATFLRAQAPQVADFIFLDPPYDSDFSGYAGRPFDLSDQRRLAFYLRHECPARFLLVIKDTRAIRQLYGDTGWRVSAFAKTYQVSFQARNDRAARHLLIANF